MSAGPQRMPAPGAPSAAPLSPSPFPARVPWIAVSAFLVIAFGLAWLITLPLWLSGNGLATPGAVLYIVGMMYTPAAAALVVSFFVQRPRPRPLAEYLGLWPLRPVMRVVGMTLIGLFGSILLVIVGVFVSATDQQIVRVTMSNPNRPDPAGDRQLQSFVVEFDRPIDPVTIGPGESFTYTLDPREVGVLVDPNTGQRHVRVSGRVTAIASDVSDPQPVLLIELLNRRTGKLESFLSFPGFSGGVFVG